MLKKITAIAILLLTASCAMAQFPIPSRHDPVDSLSQIPVSSLEGYVVYNRQDSSLYLSTGTQWLMIPDTSAILSFIITEDDGAPIDTVRILSFNPGQISTSGDTAFVDIGVEVDKNYVAVATQPSLNFIEGANITLTIVEDAPDNVVDITIASTGGASVSEGTYIDVVGSVVSVDPTEFTTMTFFDGSANQETWTFDLLAGDFDITFYAGILAVESANILIDNNKGLYFLDNLGANDGTLIGRAGDNDVQININAGNFEVVTGDGVIDFRSGASIRHHFDTATSGTSYLKTPVALGKTTVSSGIEFDLVGDMDASGTIDAATDVQIGSVSVVNAIANTGGGLSLTSSKAANTITFNTLAAADFDLAAGVISIDDATWAKDSEVPADISAAPFVTTSATGLLSNETVTNEGKDVSADLEEETHGGEHEFGAGDEIDVTDLSGELSDPQKVSVSKNSAVAVGARNTINFIEGANITLTIADDPGGSEIDVTIESSGGASVSEGAYIDVAGSVVSVDPTEFNTMTFFDGTASSETWSFDLLSGDFSIEFAAGFLNFNSVEFLLDNGSGILWKDNLGANDDSYIVRAADNDIQLNNASGNFELVTADGVIDFRSGASIRHHFDTEASGTSYLKAPLAVGKSTVSAGIELDLAGDMDLTGTLDAATDVKINGTSVFNATTQTGGGYSPVNGTAGNTITFSTFSTGDFSLSGGLFTIDDSKWAKDSEIPADLSAVAFVTTSATALLSNETVTNAGTDVSADLEEETHGSEHQDGAADEISVADLSGELADPQKTTVRKNSGANTGSQPRLNFIEGGNVTLTIAEDIPNSEIDITIASSGGASVSEGSYIDVVGSVVSVDPTEFGTMTFFDGTSGSIDWTLDLSSGDMNINFGPNRITFEAAELVLENGRAVLFLDQFNIDDDSYLVRAGDNDIQMNNANGNFEWITSAGTFDFRDGATVRHRINMASGGTSYLQAPVAIGKTSVTAGVELDLSGDFDASGYINSDTDIRIGGSSIDLRAVPFVTTSASSLLSGETVTNAGTDVSADLEEESHVSEHQLGGADELDVEGLSGWLADPQKSTVRKNSGADVGSRTRLNFIEGTNISITATDDSFSDEIDITITASGGAPTAGNYIDVVGTQVSFDPTELGDHTVGDNSEALLSITYNPSGTGNPVIAFADDETRITAGEQYLFGDVFVQGTTADLLIVDTSVSTNAPRLYFRNEPATGGTNNMALGSFIFQGNNDTSPTPVLTDFGGIYVTAPEVTANDISANIRFAVYMDGTERNILNLYGHNGTLNQGTIEFNDESQDIDFIVNTSGAQSLTIWGDDGDISIGTTSSAGKLHVYETAGSSNIILESSDTSPVAGDDLGQLDYYNNASGGGVVGRLLTEAENSWGGGNTDARFTIWTKENATLTEQFRIASNGDVSGRHGTYHTSSDSTLKKNIRKIENALEIVGAMDGVFYEWKDGRQPGEQSGVIAQQVELAIPSAVFTQANGIKNVEYDELIGALISAVNELNAKVEKMEAMQK